jgi:hypothetical protein
MVAGQLIKFKKTVRGRPRLFTDSERKERADTYNHNYTNNNCISIYGIQSPNLLNSIYIGKTKLKLNIRFTKHTEHSNRCSSKHIINAGNAYIELLDTCPLDFTQDDILQIETDWILRYREMGFNVVNKNTFSTPEKHKQQIKNFKEQHPDYYKIYYQKFKQLNPDYHKIYYQNRKQNNLLNPIGNRSQE